ncbi:hypothetical protein [uncultured Sphingomonas sp.]|uniref:hypothetical protein n=1 Tax=uncultured Sphingomonas sp. TaxID=158754 RepID=UPI0025F979B3|nr:hypothetical protein [uncultured Sphingomonas sp.]
MSDAALRRETKQLIKSTSAGFTGRPRGQDRKVRRLSYDVDDRRAQVFSRIDDGSRSGGLGWIDDIVQLAEEFDLQYRKPGERGPLQASGVRVLRILCTRFLRFASGQLDPAVRTIALATGYTYKTVHSALTRLKKHGFLDWVRRSQATDRRAGDAGPQREQVSNAYHFPMSGLPKAVLQRWKDLRERRRRRRQSEAPVAATNAPQPGQRRLPSDPAMRALLLSMEARLEGANPETGEYTRSGDQG